LKQGDERHTANSGFAARQA